VETLRSDRTIDIVTAAHPFENAAEASSPHQVKVIVNLDGNAVYFSRYAIPFPRNRTAPIKYLRHQGYLWFSPQGAVGFREVEIDTVGARRITRAIALALENGVKVHVLVTKHGSPGVDTPADAKALGKNWLAQNAGESLDEIHFRHWRRSQFVRQRILAAAFPRDTAGSARFEGRSAKVRSPISMSILER